MRKGFAVLTLALIIGGIVVGGAVIGDQVLRKTVGMGLLDLINFALKSSSTQQNAPSLEDVKAQIGISKYNELSAQRETMIQSFSEASSHISDLNNNTDAVSILNAAFGSDYKINLFSIETLGNLSFKVFDWSIKLNDGKVTGFVNGSPYGSYNVRVQLDQDVAYSLVSGKINPDAVPEWIKRDKIKINPVTEVGRFVNALPQIIKIVQKNA